MKALKKIINLILIIIILLTALPIQAIAQNVEEVTKQHALEKQQTKIAQTKEVKTQIAATDTSITTIDLTTLSTGADANHTCIFERKHDATNHWDECFICRTIKNKTAHHITTEGEYTCRISAGYQTQYCTDGCGYSKTLPKKSHTITTPWKQQPSRYMHYKTCDECGAGISEQFCTDANGNLLSCSTGKTGTCAVCGSVISNIKHNSAYVYKTENGTRYVQCASCRKTLLTYPEPVVQALSETKVRTTFHLYMEPTVDLRSNAWGGCWYSIPGATYSTTQTKQADGSYIIVVEGNYPKETVVAGIYDQCVYVDYTINGVSHNYLRIDSKVKSDNEIPKINNIDVKYENIVDGFARKATITGTFTEGIDKILQVAVLETDGTVIADWGVATRNGTTFTRTIDLVTETASSKNIRIKIKDTCGNTTEQTKTISALDSKPPQLVSAKIFNTPWNKEKIVRIEAQDLGSGQVQIAFNNQNDYKLATYENGKYVRTYRFIGDVYTDLVGAIYIKDRLGNITTQRMTIGKLDNTAPTITNIVENISTNKKSANLVVQANDTNQTLAKEGSGITGYQITTTNTQPSNFQPSNTFTVNKNGTYYLWAKDLVGNISSKTIKVVDIETDVVVTITWNDINNKYNSRTASKIKLYRKISGGQESYVTEQNITAGQTSYTFQTRECDENGNKYEFRISQDQIPGYETQIQGKNIINNLILPTYTSTLQIAPKNSFENKYLKNAQITLQATLQAGENREKLGIHEGILELNIDSKIEIHTSTIKITRNNNQQEYTLNNNQITISLPETKANDTINIQLEGTIKELGNYNNTLTYTGKLQDYRGEKTNINLGVITNSQKDWNVQYQLPEANITLTKKDSITGETITNAEFTLCEWDGEQYIEIEKIKDENQDGIYESKPYRWNHITQGKYKIVETKIPNNYGQINFEMQYTLNQLKTQNYTISPDYSNNEYKIKYTPRNPDEFSNQDGIVENEPLKIKLKIDNRDLETNNTIKSNAEFKIYEWNKETNEYEESNITMQKQEDKTYLSSNWIYYTNKNQGKFMVIQEKAPFGYYGDYEIENEKTKHYIDILQWIQQEQTNNNERTLSIGNKENGENAIFYNVRVKANILAKLIDSQTKENAQGDATLEGAIYGLYAIQDIYHPDGTTKRYEQSGLLYQKDELIEIKNSAENGETIWQNLEQGTYYIKMIQAPNGYILDEKKYKVDLNYETEEKISISQTGKIEVDVKKQAFEIFKIKENAQNLQGAGFSIYKISELSIVKEGKIERKTIEQYELKDEEAKKDETITNKANENGYYLLKDLINYYYKIQRKEGETTEIPENENEYYPYNLQTEQTAKDYTNYNTLESSAENNEQQNIQIKEIKTDENGYVKSPKLAYGEYIIIETTVPKEQDSVNPFIIQIEQDSNIPQTLKYLVDANFRTKLKIYSKDAKTGKTIINNQSKYVIKNAKTNELQTYETKEKGQNVTYGTYENPFTIGKQGNLTTPMKLEIGEYIIEQVTAPKGYVLSGKEAYTQNGTIKNSPKEQVKVTVKSNQMYHVDKQTGDYIIVANQQNEEILGNIKIKSQGEFLSNVETQKEQTNIEYETRQFGGNKYELIAKENITTNDGNETIIYKKGDKITSFETKQEEEILIENLLQGEYEIKQTTCIQGFTKKDTNTSVTVKQENQDTPIVEQQIEIQEQRQKVKIIVQNIQTSTKKPAEGGKYELYTQEEINYTDNKGKTNKIPKNTLITTITATNEGKIEISASKNKDIPQGKYYLKEIEPPKGYVLTEQNTPIDATTTTNEAEILIKITQIKSNPTKVKIIVQDAETKQKLEPVSIQIRKKDTKEIVASTNNLDSSKNNESNENKDKSVSSNASTSENSIKKIEKTQQGYIVEGVPIGKYEIIEQVQEGYKQEEPKDIEIIDEKEWQYILLENKQLLFSMEIYKTVEQIKVNGNKIKLPNNKNVYKIDVKKKNIMKDNIEIQYAIQVKNTGEIEGTIGKIIDAIPEGFEYVEKQEEKENWKIVGQNAECSKYENEILKPGESKTVKITLKWKNSQNNFGEMKNKAYLQGSSNKYNYPNKASTTNNKTGIGESNVSVIISLTTGVEIIRIVAILVALISLVILAVIIIKIKQYKNIITKT